MEPEAETVAERMRREWDARAEEDAKFYIATGFAASDEAFRASGEADLDGAVLDGVVLSPGASALEIGCGVGRLLVPLAARLRHVHGVDISPAMIEKSKAYTAGSPNVSTGVTAGALDGVPDASLDLVFSFIVFQHIPAVEPIVAYVREAARVLAPGGVLRFQVDGRAWRWEGRAATTYDGVKFTPEGARSLLAGTGLAIADEWGADTHYHWITAQRPAERPSPNVAVVPRVFDEEILLELLERCGAPDPREAASKVVSGVVSLRRALAPLDVVGADLPTEAFVRTIASRVLGRTPDDAWVREHSEILSKGLEERSDFLDILLLDRELRDLVRPLDLPVPWWRAEGIRLAGSSLAEHPTLLDAAAAAEKALAGLSGDDAVAAAFEMILGERPSPGAMAFHRRILDESTRGRRLLARHLLATPVKEESPGPLDEARVARSLLAEGGELDDLLFVRRAYDVILGRKADAGGESYYAAKLHGRELSRPAFLRELLGSAELRAR